MIHVSRSIPVDLCIEMIKQLVVEFPKHKDIAYLLDFK